MGARGLFITIEGIEGGGKSTALEYLQQFLRDAGVDLVATREPGGTQLGEELRSQLLSPHRECMDPVAELLLVFAARAQHIVEVIEPALAAGRWVLCDRFTDATYAYQGGGRGIRREMIRTLEELVQGSLRPDCTVLLDVDEELGLRRARGRGEPDRIEREAVDFFRRVRASYLDSARRGAGRYHVIDGGRSLEQVRRQLAGVGRALLAGHALEARHE